MSSHGGFETGLRPSSTTDPSVVEEGALARVSKPSSSVVEEGVPVRVSKPPSSVVEEGVPARVSKPPSSVVGEGVPARVSKPSSSVVGEGALARVSKPPSSVVEEGALAPVSKPPPKRVRVIGVGPGDPDQVTLEAVRALREVDFFVVTDKSGRGGMPDPLVNARERLLDRHLDRPPAIVRVEDPERERRPDRTATQEQYDAAVARWHEARQEAFARALESRPGDAGFLVWGDPAFYDSTLRILDSVRERGRLELAVDVIPGISSIQLLAARHRIVLHEVGQALHVTSGRRLVEALERGQDNIVVMLNRVIELPDAHPEVADWTIWWGGNLGTSTEELVAGRVGDVLPQIEAARERIRAAAGWVMDIFLLRRGS